MAIAPLQLPSSAAFTPTIDFSPLGDLGKVYREAQNRRTLADLGAGLADGSINFQQAAGQLASTGNLNGVVSLLQLGEAAKKRDAELAAGRQADSLFSSLYGGGTSTGAPVAASGDPRGIRNNNPLNLEASPFTQRQPGFSGSDGRFGQFGSMDQGFAAADNLLQSYAQRGINTIGGVIGRWAPANDGNPVSAYAQFVARKVGVDPNAPIDMSDPGVRQRVLGAMAEFENGRPVQVASAGGGALPVNAQPAQGVLPQAAPQGEEPLSPRMMGLLRARNIPNLPAAYRESIDKAIAIEQERAKLPDAIRRYKYAVSQGYRGSFMDFEKELRKSGATNVTTQIGTQAPDGKFREELDKGAAKNWTAWQEAGAVSAGQAQDMQLLDELIKVAPQGPLTGRMAEMLPGFSSAGDAFNAIVKRVAPTMRAPGSGSTSDIEYDGMLRSLPALRNKPEANMAISEMMKAKAAINIERAEVISQYSQNQISRNDAEKRISEINKRSIMTPALRQMLAGLGGKGEQPLAGDVVDGYRFKGGDPADKNSWEKAQ